MKFSIAATVVLFSLAVQASILHFNTFGETECNGFEETVPITQSGLAKENFAGPRKSFKVIESDGTCSWVVFTGQDSTGTKFDLHTPSQGSESLCFGTLEGLAFQSYEINCA